MSFNERVDALIAGRNSFLCVGLDPVYADLPADVRAAGSSVRETLVAFNRRLADATAAAAVAFKLQLKVYTAEGPDGFAALIETCRYLKEAYPEHLVILDAKYGDVGHVMARSAHEAFELCGVDAVTAFAHPGREALAPLLARPDRGCFLVCRTSNPGAADMQDVPVAGGQPYYLYLAGQAAGLWNEGGNCGLVVGATYPGEMAAVRATAPHLPLLVPGVGAQGGDLAASVQAGTNAAGGGLLISVSRGLMQAGDPGAAAAAYRDAMRAVRGAAPAATSGPSPALQALLVALFDAGILKFEPITLKSGRVSPYYFNMRALPAHPTLLRDVAAAYVERLQALRWQPDILIGIAYAGVPLAIAVSQLAGIPGGYVRAEAKGHGTRRMVEGPWQEGLRAVLIDDVISDGASKLEVQAPLQAAGLTATQMLVFVDRGQGGMTALRDAGLEPAAVTDMPTMLRVLHAAGRIGEAEVAASEAFMAESGG